MIRLDFENPGVSFHLFFFDKEEISPQDLMKIYAKENARSEKFLLNRYMKETALSELAVLDDIRYENSGRPYLADGRKISISHSGLALAVAVSDKMEVGIDIQKKSDKLPRLVEKFLNGNEINQWALKNFDNRLLHWLWTSKEAVYKAAGMKGLSFKNHMEIVLRESIPTLASVKKDKVSKKFALITGEKELYYWTCAVEVVK